MFEPEWHSQKITPTINYQAQTLPVRLDEGLFRQAMINILKNATEAMPDGGHLEVDALTLADATLIKISDQGEGCSEEDVKRVFEPFFTTKAKGTGLGLHLTSDCRRSWRGIEFHEESKQGNDHDDVIPYSRAARDLSGYCLRSNTTLGILSHRTLAKRNVNRRSNGNR